MKPITPRSYKAFLFIEAYMKQNGYSPSMQEIATALGVTKSNVGERLNRLQTAGWISRERYKQRAIKILRRVA